MNSQTAIISLMLLIMAALAFAAGCVGTEGAGPIAATAKTGDTVRAHYLGTLDDGAEFDSSEGREPLEFTIGAQEVISGFEAAVVGMSPGDVKTVTIPADEAYGPYQEGLTIPCNRSDIPEELAVIGEQFPVLKDNSPVMATVIDITESEVILDLNHPLAGKDLTFEIRLLEIV